MLTVIFAIETSQRRILLRRGNNFLNVCFRLEISAPRGYFLIAPIHFVRVLYLFASRWRMILSYCFLSQISVSAPVLLVLRIEAHCRVYSGHDLTIRPAILIDSANVRTGGL
jgi:hypothetical protein